MKILLTGDVHFNTSQFQWLKDQQESYDCICLAGDFLGGNSGEFKRQSEWVLRWMNELETQLFICSGNHDLDEFAECDWITDLRNPKICSDNQKKRFQGILFGCIPFLGADLSDFHDCDILLTHVPPLKTATSQSMETGIQKDWGERELYYAVKHRIVNPRYILCGHVENPVAKRDSLYGVEIINPGAQQNSSVPNHEVIVIETRSE
ncbi:MAG TPA: metallophosphoesterase [Desulfuromonadales bacterium]|nr:metallophosphoesterase [Desulfuromonadales bacterium]